MLFFTSVAVTKADVDGRVNDLQGLEEEVGLCLVLHDRDLAAAAGTAEEVREMLNQGLHMPHLVQHGKAALEVLFGQRLCELSAAALLSIAAVEGFDGQLVVYERCGFHWFTKARGR